MRFSELLRFSKPVHCTREHGDTQFVVFETLVEFEALTAVHIKDSIISFLMGWGVCFDLDENGRVYCVDGCSWRATKADYDGYPMWPSARKSVLQYFEHNAHRELDMIRDEFPGTAAGLARACRSHIGTALSMYGHLPDEVKIRLHEEKLKEIEEKIKITEDSYELKRLNRDLKLEQQFKT